MRKGFFCVALLAACVLMLTGCEGNALPQAPEPTPTEAITASLTQLPTLKPTPEPTDTPKPTESPTPTPEPTEAPTPTPEPTDTPEPTEAPTPDPFAPKDLSNLPEDINERVLAIAQREVGYEENLYKWILYDDDEIRYATKYGEWYGRPYSKWCVMFVSYCAHYAGLTDYPAEYSCIRHEDLLKQAGYWRDWNSYLPKPGDIVFFKVPERGTFASHCGIIESITPATEQSPAYLTTIDGNIWLDATMDKKGVGRAQRTFADVIGYGVYTKGPVYEAKTSMRDDDIPNACTPMSAPDWDVLTFIGANRTPYARYWFPEQFEPKDKTE